MLLSIIFVRSNDVHLVLRNLQVYLSDGLNMNKYCNYDYDDYYCHHLEFHSMSTDAKKLKRIQRTFAALFKPFISLILFTCFK